MAARQPLRCEAVILGKAVKLIPVIIPQHPTLVRFWTPKFALNVQVQEGLQESGQQVGQQLKDSDGLANLI